MGIDRDYSF